jgi:hypothetical protein
MQNERLNDLPFFLNPHFGSCPGFFLDVFSTLYNDIPIFYLTSNTILNLRRHYNTTMDGIAERKATNLESFGNFSTHCCKEGIIS